MAISLQKRPVFRYRSRTYLGFAVALVALQGCVSTSVPTVTPAEFGSCVKISLDANDQGSPRNERVQYVADPNCINGGQGCVTTFCRKCVISAEMESELLPCAAIPEATTESGGEVSAEADLGDLSTEDDDEGESEDDEEEKQTKFDDFDGVSGGGGVHGTLTEVSPTQGTDADTGGSKTEGAEADGDNSKSEDAEFDSEPPSIGAEDDQEGAEVITNSAALTTTLDSGLLDTFGSLLTTISTTAAATNLTEAAPSGPAGASGSELTPEAGVETSAQQVTVQNSAAASATLVNPNVTASLSESAPAALGSSPFSCEASQGDMDVGISAVVDAFCVNGGLGCFKGGCRQCRFKDTLKSMHLDVCSK